MPKPTALDGAGYRERNSVWHIADAVELVNSAPSQWRLSGRASELGKIWPERDIAALPWPGPEPQQAIEPASVLADPREAGDDHSVLDWLSRASLAGVIL